MGRGNSETCKIAKHNSIAQLDNDDKKDIKTKPIRFSHLMAFNIKEENNEISGILSVEFDYHPEDGIMKYRDINYSDKRLIKHIEGNPQVMKNIDSYLRKNLLECEYGVKVR
jgi:hypothetical protein